MLEYPNISPIIFSVGPFELRWYSLAYLGGISLAAFIFRRYCYQKLSFSNNDLLDVVTYIMAGVLLGGRLGYVLFYDLAFYLEHPLRILAIWNGGMSYHGGAIGSVVGVYLFSRTKKVDFWALLDVLGIGSTIGIGLGRLANFINGELFGRPTDMPWGMVFPTGGPSPRHPSQLYEAFLEGVVLFIILWVIMKYVKPRPGFLFGFYLIGYGSFRFFCEFFREPDVQIGTLWLGLSMGQILCLAMIGLGIGVLWQLKNTYQSLKSS